MSLPPHAAPRTRVCAGTACASTNPIQPAWDNVGVMSPASAIACRTGRTRLIKVPAGKWHRQPGLPYGCSGGLRPETRRDLWAVGRYESGLKAKRRVMIALTSPCTIERSRAAAGECQPAISFASVTGFISILADELSPSPNW